MMPTPHSVGHSTLPDTAASVLTPAQNAFVDYFRCPARYAWFETADDLSSVEGYFTLGEAMAYGRLRGGRAAAFPSAGLVDAAHAVVADGDRPELPFDLAEVVTNLREERYPQASGSLAERLTTARAIQDAYYFIRPLLPVAVRRHLQRIRLSGWQSIAFPRWPVDFSVETLMRHTVGLQLRASGVRRLPFIWFWPEGASSCAVMTHDVEGPAGQAFCSELMDLDESFGIKAAFQVVPEERGTMSAALVNHFRERGFEVNLHDLNHDGYLFRDKSTFLERAALINRYAREFGCRGFRSGAMYREQRWFDALEFSYDMSVPNAAHLEPQRGGCCTVMPYFVGKILELPLTTTQDYSLFHILGEYSVVRWKAQIDLIRSMNGFISFITHPDYLIDRRALHVYSALLAHLARLRDHAGVWIALPGQVDQWWRDRSRMTMVPYGDSWKIQGPGSERARLAYATLDGDRVVYNVDTRS
jgi:hypothetical protein